MSDNNAWAIHVRVWLAKSRNDAVPSTFGGSKIDKKNLIVVVVDDGA
jgi:hypothetical protein